MAKNLVIVESPTKVKTVGKFLGPDFTVMTSYGHIRDLKKKNLGVDVEGDFEPQYEISDDKKAVVAELRKRAKEADMVWLASDEDREGEAIAWHLYEVLKLTPERTRRIVFHEITKDAILHAIANPRGIDLNLVDAQQARRVIDRIVGFELSPVLWKKIKPALSAGRVQSVAVRLITEREREIRNFVPEEFYRVNARFATPAGQPFRTELQHRLADRSQAEAFLNDCTDTTFKVTAINTRPVKKQPAPPFTTSTLQQEASRKLGFSVTQTMMVAQRLYEAGHITYMRTDSLNLSQQAIAALKEEITTKIGAEYLQVRHYHTSSKGAQEAHEAIRPTYIDQATLEGVSAQEQRLYSLIWKRTVASQMADAVIEKTTVEVSAASRSEHFTATGEVVKFDGFMRVWLGANDSEDAGDDEHTTTGDVLLPSMEVGEPLTMLTMTATQRFTQPPARYSEGALVKKMEELGIGRPSTYAPTIHTILQREYVAKGEKEGTPRDYTQLTLAEGKISTENLSETIGSERGKLVPTDIGEVVNDFLTEYFPEILDFDFTAQIEEKFDSIAKGKLPWENEIRTFYSDFHPTVDAAMNMRLEHRVGERLLGNDPATGKPVSVKIGRYGPMIQLGEGDTDEKPQFASLLKGQSVSSITLEEALKLFEFPRNIGEYEGKDVTVAIGRFGPYVKHDNKFVSIPKSLSPSHITLDEAIELIDAKRADAANKTLRTFAEDPDMQVLNGRYGPYIKYKGANYKLPKKLPAAAEELTLEQCREIVENTAPTGSRSRKKK